MKLEHKIGLLNLAIGIGLIILFALVEEFHVLSLGIVFGAISAFNIIYGLKLLRDSKFFNRFIEENK